MGFTIKKYRVPFSFCHKLVFSVKSKGNPFDFEQKFIFFKTYKNSYTRSLCVTDLEYELYDKKYLVSVSFCHKLVFF
jgi:hypothetical protein